MKQMPILCAFWHHTALATQRIRKLNTMADRSSPSEAQDAGVDASLRLTLAELCNECRADPAHVTALVDEGALEPEGNAPADWHFAGDALRRARTALRLSQEMQLNVAGTALVLDLMDEIDALKSQLRRLGVR